MTFYQATLSQGFFRRDTPAHRNHLLPREKRRSWGSRRKDTAFPLILWQTCMWASLMTRCLIHLTKPPEEVSKDTNSVPAFDCSPLHCSSVLDYFCHTGNMLTECWAWYWTLFIFIFHELHATWYIFIFSESPSAVPFWSCIVFSSIHFVFITAHPELKCRTFKFPDDETADNVSRAEFFDTNKGFEWVLKVNERGNRRHTAIQSWFKTELADTVDILFCWTSAYAKWNILFIFGKH